MFTKASLVLIVALLIAILMNQRSQQVVHAQGSIEYKAVRTNVSVGKEGIAGTRDSKYLSTQDALDEYGKAGWQLVTQSYVPQHNSNYSSEQLLIFMRK